MAIGDRDVSYEAQDARPFIQGLVTRVSTGVALVLALAAVGSAYASIRLFSSNYEGFAVTASGAPFQIPLFRTWQDAQREAIRATAIASLPAKAAAAARPAK